jgi:hypothetical protein
MLIVYDRAQHRKRCLSPAYNYEFDTDSGRFARWGSTPDDDPAWGALEIFDLEVSTVCHGIGAGPCRFCYKSNTARGENMSLTTFQQIFHTLPRTLTQIAFGIGDLDANPDLVAMFEYCRDNPYNPGVVPNLTINGAGLTDAWASTLARLCGGVAVSVYEPHDVAYDAVRQLLDAGLRQVTLHLLVAEETLANCQSVIREAATDPRLAGLTAIVFLTLKPKGKRNTYHVLKDVNAYRNLVHLAWEHGVNIGFDSCAAPTFLAAMRDHPARAQLATAVEACESDRFSGYANVRGQYWHCSFTEGLPGYEAVDLLAVRDFQKEVWHAPAVASFRQRLLATHNPALSNDCYLCPVYNLYDAALYPAGINAGDGDS